MRIKLYNTWEKAKDTFVKPSLKVYFGKWKNDPNLPVWRTGPAIYLCPRKKLIKNCYILRNSVSIVVGTKKMNWESKEYETKICEYSQHTLPKDLTSGDYMWNRNIRKKLKKWHLEWIKPVIHLPSWMRFKILNYDVGWKPKYEDVRYEFPPQFTIIAFGLSLSFTLHCPIQNDYCNDDSYWEAILTHLYLNKFKELKETISICGIWRRFRKKEDKGTEYFRVRPEFIIKAKQEEYYAATSELKALYNNKVII